MAKSVRETIKDITYSHLKEKDGLCFGQCLTAVGWVGGTLPELYEEDGKTKLINEGLKTIWIRQTKRTAQE